jgi:hypothetical protein
LPSLAAPTLFDCGEDGSRAVMGGNVLVES